VTKGNSIKPVGEKVKRWEVTFNSYLTEVKNECEGKNYRDVSITP
jgi:hypothetical protein